MAIGMSEATRNARLQAIIDAVDADGPTEGYIEFYNGTRPATGAAVTTQTLLGTVTFGLPCATISAGTLTLNPTTDDVSVDADGTLRWARVYSGSATFIMDLTCGLAGSGADIIFTSVDALSGGVLKITAGTIAEGNA